MNCKIKLTKEQIEHYKERLKLFDIKQLSILIFGNPKRLRDLLFYGRVKLINKKDLESLDFFANCKIVDEKRYSKLLQYEKLCQNFFANVGIVSGAFEEYKEEK